MDYELRIAADNSALCRMAAGEFQRAAEAAIHSHDFFTVALSGGNTPRGVYSILADEYAGKIAWEKVRLFFGDERPVASDAPESNYRMARETLLSKAPIPPQNVHRVRTELGPQAAAEDYEAQLRESFHLAPGAWPRFDLVLLGLGDDGHTASLFPRSPALEEKSRLVAANRVEKLNTFRITLTFPVLNHAAEVVFLVSGAGKAEVLKDVLAAPGAGPFPAQRIRPEDGRLLWLVDQAAANLLPPEIRSV